MKVGLACKYKRSTAADLCYSQFGRCTEMTQRQLSDKEFEKVAEDIRKELTAGLAFLNERVAEGDKTLSHKLFNLEFGVVSPLYYRLHRHLIDWGTRIHHLQISDLKLTQYLDKEGKRYYDKLLTIPGDKS